MSTVFVGPWCAGKSTWASRYAEATGEVFIDLDDLTPEYGAEIGWSIDHLIRRNHEVGMLASELEWEHVRAHAVERVLEDWPHAVIGLGASFTSYTDDLMDSRVRLALREHSVVLVCPSLDDAISSEVCRRRAVESRGQEWTEERSDFPSWTPTKLDREVAGAVALTHCGISVDKSSSSDKALAKRLTEFAATQSTSLMYRGGTS